MTTTTAHVAVIPTIRSGRLTTAGHTVAAPTPPTALARPPMTDLGPLRTSTAVKKAPTRDGATADTRPAIPAQALPHRSPQELLRLARLGLAEAALQPKDGLRYAAAHLAALRAAAAVLAMRARPVPGRRSRVTSVWSLLTMITPELGEWAAYFAHGATKRSAAEAGIPRVVTAREADELLRASEQFVGLIEVTLGLSYHPVVDGAALDGIAS